MSRSVQEPHQAVDAGPDDFARAVMPERLPVVWLRGAGLHAVTEAQCVRRISDELDAGRGGWVATMNLDHLRRFTRDPSYAALCRRASIVVADGMPLVWASRLRGTPLPERVTGSNLIWSLSAAAAERGRSVFLLGGAPGTARASADILGRQYPSLRIAGTLCPRPGFEVDPSDLAWLAARVTAARPDVVYVGLGAPKQENLIERLRDLLPSAWWLGVGMSFSFVSGATPRAPPWMQRAGLEWLHRLAQEPGRLTPRYLVRGVPFALTLLGGSAMRRCAVAARGRVG